MKMVRHLHAAGKPMKEIRKMERNCGDANMLTDKEKDMIETVTKAYRQQKNYFGSGNARESIPNRIVSIAKPYVRPVVVARK